MLSTLLSGRDRRGSVPRLAVHDSAHESRAPCRTPSRRWDCPNSRRLGPAACGENGRQRMRPILFAGDGRLEIVAHDSGPTRHATETHPAIQICVPMAGARYRVSRETETGKTFRQNLTARDILLVPRGQPHAVAWHVTSAGSSPGTSERHRVSSGAITRRKAKCISLSAAILKIAGAGVGLNLHPTRSAISGPFFRKGNDRTIDRDSGRPECLAVGRRYEAGAGTFLYVVVRGHHRFFT